MRQALEALEYADACLKKQLTTKTKHEYAQDLLFAAGTALKQALAEPQTTHWEGCEAVHPECRKPEQEPVAWRLYKDGELYAIKFEAEDRGSRYTWEPLYTAAPTPRKPLTDEEIDRVTDQQWAQNNHKPIYAAHRAYARAIERAHGITGEQT